jgi:hypothetical protein
VEAAALARFVQKQANQQWGGAPGMPHAHQAKHI